MKTRMKWEIGSLLVAIFILGSLLGYVGNSYFAHPAPLTVSSMTVTRMATANVTETVTATLSTLPGSINMLLAAYGDHNYSLLMAVDVSIIPNGTGTWRFDNVTIHHERRLGLLILTYISGPADLLIATTCSCGWSPHPGWPTFWGFASLTNPMIGNSSTIYFGLTCESANQCTEQPYDYHLYIFLARIK